MKSARGSGGSCVWPEGKAFAFTVFDDTDYSTVESTGRVYSFLQDLGFRTTKSVWPIRSQEVPVLAGGNAKACGATCDEEDDPAYVRWVLSLQASGFEIAYHNASYSSSTREMTIAGLERFRSLFGAYPSSMANHLGCREAIYWYSHRLSGWRKLAYAIVRSQPECDSRGHILGDPYFWGDLCREKIRYVRNFVFPDVNTLRACPYMPYHDSARPFVRYWYASSEGGDLGRFNKVLSEKNQDRLEEQKGACIIYTHFANGFQEQRGLNARFTELMWRMSRKNGWYVPVSTLLDYLLSQKSQATITDAERAELEWRWLRYKITVGTT